MKEEDVFVCAGTVYFGQWIPYDEMQFTSEETPETILLAKESFTDGLPKECKILADIVLNLPEELFLVNGKIKKTAFHQVVKAKTGWSVHKIEITKERLRKFLRNPV
jgi:hypothetical protein